VEKRSSGEEEQRRRGAEVKNVAFHLFASKPPLLRPSPMLLC